jgi:hypothetical protein
MRRPSPTRRAGISRHVPGRAGRCAAVAAVLLCATACRPLDPTTDGDGVDTAKPLVASAAEASRRLSALEVAPSGSMSGYVRDKFKTWDAQGGGCDTRDVVLKRDGKGVKVEGSCAIVAGTWVSPYNGKTYHTARDMQIDHLVPLGNAWISGADSWSASRREAFANDLTDPQLLAVDGGDNESKGDDDPSRWKPPSRDFWCTYAKDWISVKSAWHLTVTVAEKSALGDMLHTCV